MCPMKNFNRCVSFFGICGTLMSSWATVPPQPPSLAVSNVTIVAGETFTLPLDGNDPGGLPLTFSVVSNGVSGLTPRLVTTNRTLHLNVSVGVTTNGDLMLELFEHLTPKTTARIISLVNSNFYNGLTFHRIVQDFVAQGGDPHGDGTGGSGVTFDDEFVSGLTFQGFGQLAMANSGFVTGSAPLGRDNNDAQFFITAPNLAVGGSATPPRHLNYRHTIFGQLTHGFDIFGQLMATPVDANNHPLDNVVINSATIITNRQATVLYLTAPTNAVGPAPVTVQAQNSDGLSTQVTFQVTVVANTVNNPPFFNPMPAALVVTQGMAINFPFGAWDDNGDSMSLGLWNANTGNMITNVFASYNPTSGLLTLAPVSDFLGRVELLFGVWDAYDHNGNSTSGAAGDIQEYDSQRIAFTVVRSNLVTITTTANPTNGGSVSGGGEYIIGNTIALTATATNGWVFTNWNDGNTNNPRTVIAAAGGASYTANFAVAATITALPGVAGQGTVFGNGVHALGSSVPLFASGSMGWKFTNWSDGNTNNPRTVVASNSTYTANFASAQLAVLLQAGNGGMAGLWTLGTNYLPATWATVTGPLGASWVLRAIDQNRILLQQGDGGQMTLWNLDANGTPVSSATISAALPGWIARDLDGNRVLLQNGDGGMIGIWTLGTNNTPIAWSSVNGAVPNLIARALCGTRLLLQFGTTASMGYWTLNGNNAITAWTPLTSGLPAGWIPRSMTDNYILLQQGDGGTTALWDLDGNGQPVALHTINGPLAGWIMRGMDQTFLTTLTVASSTNLGGAVTGGGTYSAGASVTLTATASNGWIFTGWNDGLTNNPRRITVAADGGTYTANFAPGVIVTLQGNPASGGALTGAGTYGAGTLVALSAQPNLGWKFANWSDGDTNQTRQITLEATSTNLTANFSSAPMSVLLQAGDGGMAGLWGLGTNYQPETWTTVTGALGNGWVLRALHQNRALLQQGVGGKIELWDLGTNGAPVTKWPVSAALPGWIARDLDGNRILLQAGDGGLIGLWTLSTNNTPATWMTLNGAVPGLVARSLSGTRILVQFGGGTLMGYWTLNGSNAITAWTQINSGLPAGWVLRSMTDRYILLQAGDGGMAGLWDLDANGQPIAWHVVSGPLPGWIMRGIDQP
ncbi:MAG: hypothetical protein EPN23_07235 [Verrucomicrobia bacterium]|nr:MAG: hypothetical protein EPN23_07235 [Verrucomicrobiota bacterium]